MDFFDPLATQGVPRGRILSPSIRRIASTADISQEQVPSRSTHWVLLQAWSSYLVSLILFSLLSNSLLLAPTGLAVLAAKPFNLHHPALVLEVVAYVEMTFGARRNAFGVELFRGNPTLAGSIGFGRHGRSRGCCWLAPPYR